MYLNSWMIYPIYIESCVKKILRKNIQVLQNIVSIKGSRILTFSIPHVLKALQMLSKERFVSRATFRNEIHLGEGAVKTLILHLKEAGIADSTKSGTFLTDKGRRLTEQLQNAIPKECRIEKCSHKKNKISGCCSKNNDNLIWRNNASMVPHVCNSASKQNARVRMQEKL